MLGSLSGIRETEGMTECPCSLKKARYLLRSSDVFITGILTKLGPYKAPVLSDL